MIISHVLGGLGNQMFQYAAGRALALTNGCACKLDISGFSRYPVRRYELDSFRIRAEVARQEDVKGVVGFGSKFITACRRRLKLAGRRYVIDRDYRFVGGWDTLRAPVYLEGYWQSYRYFESHAAVIRSELVPKGALSSAGEQLAKLAADTESVSIHVRRGDYLGNPVHGFVGLGYYDRAIATARERVERPHFLVFSDDVEWARRNIKAGASLTFVDNNGENAHEDMHLMSLCKHNIIANSTFSWWAAWLNINPTKSVIYPREWLADTSVVPDYDAFLNDLIPYGWIAR